MSIADARTRTDTALHEIMRRVDELLWDHVDNATAARMRPWFKDRIADLRARLDEERAAVRDDSFSALERLDTILDGGKA